MLNVCQPCLAAVLDDEDTYILYGLDAVDEAPAIARKLGADIGAHECENPTACDCACVRCRCCHQQVHHSQYGFCTWTRPQDRFDRCSCPRFEVAR